MLRAFGVLVAALIGLTVSSGAHAQSQPVFQSGIVTPRHVLAWATNGVAEDPEQVSIGGLSQLTLTNTGTPLCINDALTTAIGGYHQFCFGANSLGGGLISYQAYGGAPPLALQCNINGTVLPCFPSGGNVTASTSPAPVAGNAAKWGGGTVLLDAGIPPAYQVDTIAALKALPLTLLSNGVAVQVNGYWAKGQAPAAVYRLSTSTCSLNAGAGDGGSQIPSATSGNCWLKSPAQNAENVVNWGATGSLAQTTCTMSATSTTATLGAADDFVNGQPVACIGAGAAFATQQVTSLTVTTEGTPGSTKYCYQIATIDGAMGVGMAVSEACATDGNATLGTQGDLNAPAQYEHVCWTAPSTGPTPSGYVIYGRSTGAETFIATASQVCFNDYGTASSQQQARAWIPSTPLLVAQNDVLRTTIASGAGTTSVVLVAPSVAAVSGMAFIHDDSAALLATIAASSNVYVPAGTFNILTGLALTANGQSFDGCGPECTTIAGWGSINDLTLGPTSQHSGMEYSNVLFDDTQKSTGITQEYTQANSITSNSVWTNNPFNWIDINTNSKNILISDGRYFGNGNSDTSEVHVWDLGSFSGTTTQIITFDKLQMRNTIGSQIHLDGNVDAVWILRSNILSSTAPEVLLDNAVSASSFPTNVHVIQGGFNTCQTICLDAEYGHDLVISDTWMQGQNNSTVSSSNIKIGSNFYTVRLNNDNIFNGAVDGVSIFGADVFIGNSPIYNSSEAAIRCRSTCRDLTVSGGGSYDAHAGDGTIDNDYGVMLDAGSQHVSISGNWVGQIANIKDSTSPSTDVTYQGFPSGSPVGWPSNIIDTTGSKALTVASFPALYGGTGGRIATLDIGTDSAGGGRTYTFDTAAAIAAVDPIGTVFTIRVFNHTNNTITIAGDTGTTPGGVTTIPASGGSSMTTYLDIHGVVTSGPAVALNGCAKGAGTVCY